MDKVIQAFETRSCSFVVARMSTEQSLPARGRDEIEVVLVPEKNGPVTVPLVYMLRGTGLRRTVSESRKSTELLQQVSRVTCLRREEYGARLQQGGTWSSLCGRYASGVAGARVESAFKRLLCRLLGGNGSTRAFRSEQTLRRRRGGMEVQPFVDCRVELVMRRKYFWTFQEM